MGKGGTLHHLFMHSQKFNNETGYLSLVPRASHRPVLIVYIMQKVKLDCGKGQLEKQGNGVGTENRNGKQEQEFAQKAAGADTTRNSRSSSQIEPGTTKSRDSC